MHFQRPLFSIFVFFWNFGLQSKVYGCCLSLRLHQQVGIITALRVYHYGGPLNHIISVALCDVLLPNYKQGGLTDRRTDCDEWTCLCAVERSEEAGGTIWLLCWYISTYSRLREKCLRGTVSRNILQRSGHWSVHVLCIAVTVAFPRQLVTGSCRSDPVFDLR